MNASQSGAAQAKERPPAPPPHDLPDDGASLSAHAEVLLRRAKHADLSLATAESCTGGLIAALFTDIEGLSSTFDRGFVTYSEESKCDLLGIPAKFIEQHGVVSAQVAAAMARGAIERSAADLAIAVTGYAGKAGPDNEAGLVHVALHGRHGDPVARECHFGLRSRDEVRHLTARNALQMLEEALAARGA